MEKYSHLMRIPVKGRPTQAWLVDLGYSGKIPGLTAIGQQGEVVIAQFTIEVENDVDPSTQLDALLGPLLMFLSEGGYDPKEPVVESIALERT